MRRPEQVFVYVSKRCNARCLNCYVEPVSAQALDADLSFEDALAVLEHYRHLGALKVTFLGGEPTIHHGLPDLIVHAKRGGYGVVRINTNGMWPPWFRLEDERLQGLDIISFSIDGSTPETNDTIRWGCRLETVLQNMRYAQALGFEVRVNSTIRDQTLVQVFDIIRLAENHGASKIYLNAELLDAPDGTVVGVDARGWMIMCLEVIHRRTDFSIEIEIAPMFSPKADLPLHEMLGHRCLAADSTRGYVNEKGQVWPCLLFLNNPVYCEGRFQEGRLVREQGRPPRYADLHRYCHFLHSPIPSVKPLCIYYRLRVNRSGQSEELLPVMPISLTMRDQLVAQESVDG